MELAQIYPDAPIYTLTFDPKLARYFDPSRIRTSYLQRLAWLPAQLLLPLYARAIESFDFSDYSVVISSSHSFAKNIITKPSTHHISYIHSPMRYAWDYWHEYLAGKKLSPITNSIVRSMLHRLRVWDYFGAARVDTFVANSAHVARRIFKYYRRDAVVIHPPVAVEQIAVSQTSEDFFLVISRLSRYKQIDIAVEACKQLGLPLVVVGEGEDKARLQSMAGPQTSFVGWVDDDQKYNYLARCRALLFCSEEDFGIVPVEAMAAGKPVIAYGEGGVLETVEDGKSGLFFSEPTAASLQSAIERFMARSTGFDPATICQRAEQFSTQIFTDKIKALVEQVSK